MKNVTIYTDGACSGNPGPGGWGAVLLSGAHRKELSGGTDKTTNNRMELVAAIEALKALNEPAIVAFLERQGLPVGTEYQRWESIMAID